jgi:hypothetical protein
VGGQYVGGQESLPHVDAFYHLQKQSGEKVTGNFVRQMELNSQAKLLAREGNI